MKLDGLIDRFVTDWFSLHPQVATEKGKSGFDHLAADYSHQNVDLFLRKIATINLELENIDSSKLETSRQIDYRLLSTQLKAVRHPFEHRKVLTQNPVFYLQAALDGLEALRLRRKSVPWRELESRLTGLPSLLEIAQTQLTEPKSPAVEIAREMSEEAIEELRATFLRSDVPTAVKAAAREALKGLTEFCDWLAAQRPQEFSPMGASAFESLLTTEHLLQRSWIEWEALAQTALLELDLQLSQQESMEHESEKSLSPSEVWAYYVSELDRVKKFVEKSDVVTIPRGELLLCNTPAYLESLIPGPFYLEPAAYSGDRLGHFYLPDFPKNWTAEIGRRYARRKISGTFTNLVVHEAWPGHHLQFLHAVENHHPLRNLRDNDVMLEGWALYCEELMEEVGLHGDQPFLPRLYSLKFRVLRVVLDIGIHTGNMSLQAAEDLMSSHFPSASKSWITAEIRRYAMEPGQALSYWVGAQLIKELKEELGVERKHYREFHDTLLSFGAIPLPLITENMRRNFRVSAD